MGDGNHKSTVFRRCLNILYFMPRIIFLCFWNRCFPVCENVSLAGSSDASGNLKVYLYFDKFITLQTEVVSDAVSDHATCQCSHLLHLWKYVQYSPFCMEFLSFLIYRFRCIISYFNCPRPSIFYAHDMKWIFLAEITNIGTKLWFKKYGNIGSLLSWYLQQMNRCPPSN